MEECIEGESMKAKKLLFVFAALVLGGAGSVWAGGRVYGNVGAFYTRGQIMDRWLALGAQNSTLGYPDSDRVCNSTTDDCHQSFQDGALYSSTLYGAKWVHGLILSRYLAEGADAGWLGSPTAGVDVVPGHLDE